MQYRRVGRSDVHLSAIGFGTAQVPMIPESQAIAALERGFALGVNWVHVSHEYGDAEALVARAVRNSRRDIVVLAQASGDVDNFAASFERTCSILGRRQLGMFGINCVNDCEYLQQNVWGPGGMAEFLARMKRQGRIGATFCTTHGQPEDIERVIRSGYFDAVMMAYNPVGFHLFTYYPESLGRTFEDIPQHRDRVFPVALEHDVSVLVMKALGGGLLCRSKAVPPHEWLGPEDERLRAGDLLKLALDHPAVCGVVVGTGSVEEAEENAMAGHEPIVLTPRRRDVIARAVERFRTEVCSRCGKCESTCSRSLPIATMFRDVYVWNHRSEPSMPLDRENYFLLHPDDVLTCAHCTEQTCLCPQGLAIPRQLARAHDLTTRLRDAKRRPGAPSGFPEQIVAGRFPALVLSRDVPERAVAGTTHVLRLIVHNAGESPWLVSSWNASPALAVRIDGRLLKRISLRYDVPPGGRTAFAFELRAPEQAGPHHVEITLVPRFGWKRGRAAQILHAAPLVVDEAIRTDRSGPTLSDRARGLRRLTKALVHRVKYAAECIERQLPERLPAGTNALATLTVKNRGRLPWRAGANRLNRLTLVVRVDAEVQSTHPLPVDLVEAGHDVSFHVPLRAPSTPGFHAVSLELAGRTMCSAELFVETMDESAARTRSAAAQISPWHYTPSHGIEWSRTADSPFPSFVSRAKGCHLWDTDGIKYIDYIMGWGTALLGYADDRVQDAVRAMLDTAPLAPLPYAIETEVAQMITEDFPSAEMVIFGKNGSDVCTVAARMARALTGRRVILFSGYHGWQDFWVESVGSVHSGVPDRDQPLIHRFRFNDREDFFRLFHLHRHDLAAVMIEPSGPWGGDDVGPEPDADAAFLADIADATRRAGALLVFDEIVTGYRYPGGSVQKATGVVPDLTCLGKALAAGMPLSALGGRADLMRDGLPRTHYGPTFRSEAYSFAAAKAAIEIYRREPVAAHVWQFGSQLQQHINSLCQQLSLNAECKGPPFRIATMFTDTPVRVARKRRALYAQELLKHGITTLDGVMLPSYAHGTAALDATKAAVQAALESIASADSERAIDRQLEIPV